MIKEYQKQDLIKKISQKCSLFKAVKNSKPYFMYEYIQLNQSDEFNFRVIKKLGDCSHVLGFIQKISQKNRTYFITDYVSSNLLEEQKKQQNQIYQISKALQIFAKIVQIIEQIHRNNIIYRNFQVQTIGIQNNEIFLSDFRFCQIVKRKQKYFQVVGNSQYMAPQFYSRDGYGFEVDIWAAGVCLYFMLTGSFPFDFQDKNNEQILQLIQKKCMNGFSFLEISGKSAKQKNLLLLQDLFKKIFSINADSRITVTQLKKHPALNKFFGIHILNSKDMSLSIIQEEGSSINESILPSIISVSSCNYEFQKEQILLDFMQHSSEVLMLDRQSFIIQQLKNLVNFSILKVALLKANNFMNVILGIKKPSFKIQSAQWQKIKVTPNFSKMKQKVEKKKKIIQMLFKSALLNVKQINQKSSFYSEEIPQDFQAVKHQYRKNLSKMFDLQKEVTRKKQDKEKVQKSCQRLARLTILCLINRIFQQNTVKRNFSYYFAWSKNQSLQNLQEWLQNQSPSNLKNFIIQMTSTYME